MEKKQTNRRLSRRIENALLHIDRTNDTKSVFFSDKGLRLTTTNEYALVETGYHQHVFNSYTSSGVSRPWLYVNRLIDITIENDCQSDGGYSFVKLVSSLKEKDDKSEYNLCIYIEWWLYNIFSPLYTIGESYTESFLVYEDYLHNIAKQEILLSEIKEDMTNKQFVGRMIANLKEFTNNITEYTVLNKKTDEELMRENIEAIQENEYNDTIEYNNGN